jgi:hypothetical protein
LAIAVCAIAVQFNCGGRAVGGWFGIRLLTHAIQIRQTGHDPVRRDTKVEQASDLIDAGAFATVGHLRAGSRRSEETAGFEVAFEREIQHGIDLLRRHGGHIHFSRFHAARQFESRKG